MPVSWVTWPSAYETQSERSHLRHPDRSGPCTDDQPDQLILAPASRGLCELPEGGKRGLRPVDLLESQHPAVRPCYLCDLFEHRASNALTTGSEASHSGVKSGRPSPLGGYRRFSAISASNQLVRITSRNSPVPHPQPGWFPEEQSGIPVIRKPRPLSSALGTWAAVLAVLSLQAVCKARVPC